MPRLRDARASLEARQPDILSPFIPLQQSPSPKPPLIPLQLPPPPPARLQHELSHNTIDTPDHTTPIFPAPTELPSLQLRRRQNVFTTVTDADVIVVDGDGHTVGVTVIPAVSTGSLAITLPFTTLTLPPLSQITGIIPIPIPTQTGAATVPVLTSASQVGGTPQPTLGSPNPLQSSSLSVQIPDTTSQQVLSSPLPTPGIPSPGTTGTGNNNLGMPSSSTALTQSPAASSLSNSTSTSFSSTITPTTLATLTSSSLSFSNSTLTSSSHSSSLSSLTSSSTDSSTTGLVASSTGSGDGLAFPTGTGEAPAATSTDAGATTTGSAVNVPVVGGVVGGLAGFAILLVVLLLIIRWWRRRHSEALALRSIDDESYAPGTSHSNAPMTQNNAAAGTAGAGAGAAGVAGAAGLGAVFKRLTAGSNATTDTAPSERGFQNFGGRKLESVLVSGGDGYGEPVRSGNQTPTSFSRGWSERFPYDTPSKHSSMVVGPATPFRRPSTSVSGVAELAGSSSTATGRPDSDTVKMMPSPARAPTYTIPGGSRSQPMSEMTGLSPPKSRQRQLLNPFADPRPSEEGSRGSKFTEDL